MAPTSGGAYDVAGVVAVHNVNYERPPPGQPKKFYFSIFLDPAVQGRGIGSKATQECLDAFKDKRPEVEEVYGDVHFGNDPSAALMRKTGFVPTKGAQVGNIKCDRYVYTYK
jgi:RimJ/RimL family protein N-acetyltransferase